MKRTILISALILTVASASVAQVIIRDNTRRADSLFEKTCMLFCSQYDINNVMILISPIDVDQALLSVEGGNASIRVISENAFNINIDRAPRMIVIRYLVHELFHIKQILDSRLLITDNGWLFNDTLYNSANSRYEKRPFEIEATEDMWQFINSNKEQIKNIFK